MTTETGFAALPASGDDYQFVGLFGGRVLQPLGGRVDGYLEGALLPVEKQENIAFAGVGLGYRVAPALRVDAFANHGLTEASPNWNLGLGISARFLTR